MKKKSTVSVIMGLGFCWDLQVFPGQEGIGPQRVLQTWGSRDKPLTWTVGSWRGGKRNPVPFCEISLNRKVAVSSTEMAVVWNQVKYWDGILGRCPEEHFDASLRRKKTCGYLSTQGLNRLKEVEMLLRGKAETSPDRSAPGHPISYVFIGHKACFHNKDEKTSLQLLRPILSRGRKARHPTISLYTLECFFNEVLQY